MESNQHNKPKLYVIKIGGNVIDDEVKLKHFLSQLSMLFNPSYAGKLDPNAEQTTNVNTPLGAGGLLVHGGGKVATTIGNSLGISANYINGRRITDDATIDLVTMVYGGLVNKKIVAQLQALGVNAIGLTGADLNIIPATKRPVKEVDFGWVGDINPADINPDWFSLLLSLGVVPVFAPLTHDGAGHMLNTNADTIASSLAIALSHEFDVRLIYCFEKKGVLEDVNDEHSIINHINREKYQQLISKHKLFEGILPKLENALAAIDAGVHEVLIGDANDIIQNTTSSTTGTLITA